MKLDLDHKLVKIIQHNVVKTNDCLIFSDSAGFLLDARLRRIRVVGMSVS